MVKRFRRGYGAGPLHLLALVASLLISGAAVLGWFDSFTTPDIVRILIWFLGAIVAHDLILLPIYSLLDRGALHASGHPHRPAAAVRAPAEPPGRTPGWVYVRVPALLSGLLVLVFFPEALRLGNPTFQAASGMTQDVYLSRLLLTCAALFVISGVAYAINTGRVRRGSAVPIAGRAGGEGPGSESAAAESGGGENAAGERPGAISPDSPDP